MIISQSYIKDLLMYIDKHACGKQIEAKFFNGHWDWFEGSFAKSIGCWFEYECTGSIPKNGMIPYPQKTVKGELTTAYKNMLPHIENFKLTLETYGIEIVDTNVKLKHGDEEGTLDIVAKFTKPLFGFHEESEESEPIANVGDYGIIDLKTSGLLDDKWSEFGWDLTRLAQKEKLILQPIQYTSLWQKNYGNKPIFLFFLFNTKSATDFRILNFVIDDDDIISHESTIRLVKENTERILRTGWKAYPTTKRCRECPIQLRMDCKDYAAVPKIINFYFSRSNT
jgi:hypothetical protein